MGALNGMTTKLDGGFRPVQITSPAATDAVPRLDRLAARLSTSLLKPAGAQFDALLEETLRQITIALGVDASVLVQFSDDPKAIGSFVQWRRPDAPAVDLRALCDAPWLLSAASGRRLVAAERFPHDLPPDGRIDHVRLDDQPVTSMLVVPVSVEERPTCALCALTLGGDRRWSRSVIEGTQLLAEILGTAVHRKRQHEALDRAGADVARLHARLESENEYLKEEIETLQEFDEIVGESQALRGALARVQDVAPTDATVLLVGETGTGKELFARAVHERSHRRQRPLIRVNCAALPASLIESELFGHERGAFTGAVGTRHGRFELAHQGTIFLDEIGDLPMELQPKLLRVLQEGEFERLGSSHTRKVDVRVVAATHQNLEAAIDEGRFRADLYYRLSVFPIPLPSLRERREDIPRLVWFFIHRRQRSLHRRITKVPVAVMDALTAYAWPGNVRELENVVERAMIRSTGDTLCLDKSLGPSAARDRGRLTSLEVVERRHIEEVLRRCGWRINGRNNAADQLGLHPSTLRFRMRKLGIVRAAQSQGAVESGPIGHP